MFMQFFIRYYSDPYEDSRIELFYKDEILSFGMPKEKTARYEWNETLIAFLDLADKAMKQASGDKRLFVKPGRIYSVWLTEPEFKGWIKRFTQWSTEVKRRPDYETNKRVYRGG